MDAAYVRRKEVSEGGTAGITIFSNVVLVVTIFKSDGCNDDANCATLVFLFMSICVYVVVTVLVPLLAVRQSENEKIRKGIEIIQLQNEEIKFHNEKLQLQN